MGYYVEEGCSIAHNKRNHAPHDELKDMEDDSIENLLSKKKIYKGSHSRPESEAKKADEAKAAATKKVKAEAKKADAAKKDEKAE